MNDCLVIGPDSCSVVQNHDFSFEFPDRSRLKLAIDKHHTLTEVIPLKLFFLDLSLDSEADRLTGESLIYVDSLVVDTFDLHRIKLPLLIRSKKQRLVWNNCT